MRRLFAVLVLLALLFSVAPVAAQPAPAGKAVAGKAYIVQLLEDPVVSYKGGIAGLKATKPKQGQKIDPLSTDVVKYASYLTSRHDSVLNGVGGGRKLYSYVYSFNGFAAELNEAQVARLRSTAGVLAVTKEEIVQADTSSTPDFLGLTKKGGLWDQLGGSKSAGENIIIGIIDSGIWPEQLSFSDRTGENGNATKDGKLSYQQIPGWHGKCVPGEQFAASDCNQKLIGAQYFNAGWGGDAGMKALLPWEFASTRDYNGHGTHTASTAGGNANVKIEGAASVFGSISGIAPRARIAAYKALWHQADGGASGRNTDLVAAIDQAVADGVDVINYSISGSLTNFMDPVMVSFLYAADAGIFVATSAGNNGPDISTVAHPGPWVTTVAAGTHNRVVTGSVTLGNGVTYTGASVATTTVGPAPLVDSVNAALPGVSASSAARCYLGALDPAKVAGKIVLCERGGNARVEKSQAVMEAGGIGMIQVNPTTNSLNADFHFVPSIHLQATYYAALKAYAAEPGATATVNKAAISYDAPAPYTASFSSRGPLLAGGGDLLKPDLIAPGQDILAAVAPPGNSGRLYDLYSGTSMSSPHVAGLAALLKNLHPDWSPMAIKSALMTTGYDILDTDTTAGGGSADPEVIFRQGAGYVQPNFAADPGLVFNAGWNSWLAFLCGTTNGVAATTCTNLKNAGYSVDPSDMNVASIAIGDMAGAQTVTRTVTNVSAKAETYTAEVSGLTGLNVVVSPATFTVNPGKSQKLAVSFTHESAPLNAYVGGQITWRGSNGHVVRIPVVVRPMAVSTVAEVSGSGASGSLSFDLKFGYNGNYTAAAQGLVPATTFDGNVPDDPTDEFVVGGPGIVAYDVEIPAGTALARFQLFDEYTDGEDDLDLYVYFNDEEVGMSGGGTAAEQVSLLAPEPGTYTVYVHGWGTDGPDANFTLFSWLVDGDAGNMTLTAPTTAVREATGTIGVSWTGLAPDTKYLGAVSHTSDGTVYGLTVISIDVP